MYLTNKKLVAKSYNEVVTLVNVAEDTQIVEKFFKRVNSTS